MILHDIAPEAIKTAKVRLRKAGIRNVQSFISGDPELKQFEEKCDWVIELVNSKTILISEY